MLVRNQWNLHPLRHQHLHLLQHLLMVAVGEGMENGDVRCIKMVTKEVDEEIWTIAMRI